MTDETKIGGPVNFAQAAELPKVSRGADQVGNSAPTAPDNPKPDTEPEARLARAEQRMKDALNRLETFARDTARRSMTAAGAWAAVGDDHYEPIEATQRVLSPGWYDVKYSPNGVASLKTMTVTHDRFVALPCPVTSDALADFKEFWKMGGRYAAAGLMMKRGMIISGEPGVGKSSIIWTLAHYLVETLGGIVIQTDKIWLLADMLPKLRQIEPHRPVLIVIEDVERYIGDDLAALLSILDGARSIANVYTVATTNHFWSLPDALSKRPGRFDRVKELSLPNDKIRSAYLRRMWDKSPEEVQEIVRLSEGWTLAHLREYGLSVYDLGRDPDETFNFINAMVKDPSFTTKERLFYPDAEEIRDALSGGGAEIKAEPAGEDQLVMRSKFAQEEEEISTGIIDDDNTVGHVVDLSEVEAWNICVDQALEVKRGEGLAEAHSRHLKYLLTPIEGAERASHEQELLMRRLLEDDLANITAIVQEQLDKTEAGSLRPVLHEEIRQFIRYDEEDPNPARGNKSADESQKPPAPAQTKGEVEQD